MKYDYVCPRCFGDMRTPVRPKAHVLAEHLMQAPIAKITIVDGIVQRAGMYAPGLPDGEHELYCDNGEARIEQLERALRSACLVMSRMKQSHYDLGNLARQAFAEAENVLGPSS